MTRSNSKRSAGIVGPGDFADDLVTGTVGQDHVLNFAASIALKNLIVEARLVRPAPRH
jgi:hypothetical protein